MKLKRSTGSLSKHLVFALLILLQTFFLKGIAQNFTSPTDLDKISDNKLLITDKTGKQLIIYNTDEHKVVKTIALNKTPTGSEVSLDRKLVFTTAGIGPGTVMVVDISGKIKKKISTGHGINSPQLSLDGKKLYVCSRFDNSVKIIDINKGKEIKSVSVTREPVASAISPDGKLLFVVNHMPDGRADLDYVASKMSVIDLQTDELIKTINLVNGAEGMRGVCFSPDGKYVYATHLMARFQVPTTQIERGWINTNAISVIRVNDFKLLYTVLLDDVDKGFANPWAIEPSPNGKMLFVSSAGNNEIRIIDLPAMTVKIQQAVKSMGETAEAMHLNAHNDLSFISDVSSRVKLKGIGPRALLYDKDRLYIAEYFSETLGEIAFSENGLIEQNRNHLLGKNTPMTAIRQGEIFFNDASLCFQNWQSCASCHSDDGRTDALNWDLLNDGIGNPKNVKSLLYSHQTPPVMGLGVREDAETAVRAGIKFIQFAVRPEEDAQAIDAYLKSLKPVPSPFLKDGKLTKAASRGKQHFESEGCAHCHPAPLYTNLKGYDLGTGKDQDEGKKFDTSTLVEVWRTAPYWHDGRAETIEEAIRLHYVKGTNPLKLSEKELAELSEYVKSL